MPSGIFPAKFGISLAAAYKVFDYRLQEKIEASFEKFLEKYVQFLPSRVSYKSVECCLTQVKVQNIITQLSHASEHKSAVSNSNDQMSPLLKNFKFMTKY